MTTLWFLSTFSLFCYTELSISAEKWKNWGTWLPTEHQLGFPFTLVLNQSLSTKRKTTNTMDVKNGTSHQHKQSKTRVSTIKMKEIFSQRSKEKDGPGHAESRGGSYADYSARLHRFSNSALLSFACATSSSRRFLDDFSLSFTHKYFQVCKKKITCKRINEGRG